MPEYFNGVFSDSADAITMPITFTGLMRAYFRLLPLTLAAASPFFGPQQKEILLQAVADRVHLCLKSVEILVQSGTDDDIHLSLSKFRAQHAPSIVRKDTSIRLSGGSRDHAQRFTCHVHAVTDRARELAVRHQELHDV